MITVKYFTKADIDNNVPDADETIYMGIGPDDALLDVEIAAVVYSDEGIIGAFAGPNIDVIPSVAQYVMECMV